MGSGGDKGKPHRPCRAMQVRFISVCRDGHMRDFPWIEWLGLDRDEWSRTRSDRWLRLLSTGSASTAGVVVVAERREASGGIVVVKKRSLAGAFGDDMGIACDAQNPALGIGHGGDEPDGGCLHSLKAVLRGASNLYFADVRSSIYVPEVEDRSLPDEVLDLLDDQFKQDLLNVAFTSDSGLLSARSVRVVLKRRYPESQVDPETLADAGNKHVLHEALTHDRLTATLLVQKAKLAPDKRVSAAVIGDVIAASSLSDWAIDPELLVGPTNNWIRSRDEESAEEDTSSIDVSEGAFRSEEYLAFCRDGQEGMPKTNLLVRSFPIHDYEPLIRDRFSRVALLDRLRETRAFVGFSRLFATPTHFKQTLGPDLTDPKELAASHCGSR